MATSLPGLLPTALVLGGMAATGTLRGRARAFCAGAALVLLPLAGWSLFSVAWSRFWQCAIIFNTGIYARANGLAGPLGLYGWVAADDVRHWLGFGDRSWQGLEPVFTAAALLFCAWLWRRRGWAWGLGALVTLGACRLAAQAPGLEKGPLFHASAYYRLCILIIAAAVARLAAPRQGAALALLTALSFFPLRLLSSLPRLYRYPIVGLVSAVTEPADPVWFLLAYPLFNLQSGRLPIAYPYYLPWLEDAEGPKVLEALRAEAPKLVFLKFAYLRGVPWPRPDDPLVRRLLEDYVLYRLDGPFGGRPLGRAQGQVTPDGLYVRRDFEGEFLSRLKRVGARP
jgi:hypothetical protein